MWCLHSSGHPRRLCLKHKPPLLGQSLPHAVGGALRSPVRQLKSCVLCLLVLCLRKADKATPFPGRPCQKITYLTTRASVDVVVTAVFLLAFDFLHHRVVLEELDGVFDEDVLAEALDEVV